MTQTAVTNSLAPVYSDSSCVHRGFWGAETAADAEHRHKRSHPRSFWLLSQLLYLLLHSTKTSVAHAQAEIPTPRTRSCASWDICRTSPSPTKGLLTLYTDHGGETLRRGCHNKCLPPFLFSCKLTFSSVACFCSCTQKSQCECHFWRSC